MNKKGFTLVELLAAITILALLALITVPAVTKPIKESKEDLYNSQLRAFKDSAKSWGADNMFSELPDKGECMLLPLQVLIDDGFVEPDVKNSLDGSIFKSQINYNNIEGVFVKIENQGSDNNRYVYNVYDCKSNNCSNPDKDNTVTYDEASQFSDESSYNSSCTIYRR